MSAENIVQAIINRIRKEIRNERPRLAIVKTPPPQITISIRDQVIETEQILVSRYLLPNYFREYKIDGTVDNIELTTREISGNMNNITLSNSTSTSPAGEGPHTHAIPTIDANGTFESKGEGSGVIKGDGVYQTHGKFWFTDTLKVGDIVRVDIIGNKYVITDHLVSMPNDGERVGED